MTAGTTDKTPPMTDNLRTRIAAAIDAQYTTGVSHRTYDDWLKATADAVIRELEADCILVPKSHTLARMTERELFGQHLAVGDDGPFMLNISPKEQR